MASLINVRLNKGDAPSWGFRLQGGKDFATPLVVQKVNVGSPAERAGLQAGDSVIKINNTDVFDLRHKDAQDVVLRAGNNFDMTLQRGGSTWRPHVTPTGKFPNPSPVINNASPVTKTSLKHNRQDNIGAIGTGHNVSAQPFNAVNGAVNGGPKLVNKQYNSPLHLYSDQSIAETLAAQSEVLSTGALGVNFKKNEKDYDASNSAVFRMLQEAEKEPRSPDAETDSGIDTRPNLGITGLRHVHAPEYKPPAASPQLPPGQNICADCERLIVGVFVRIKDKNLHVECFKCATCGTSLKNVGYYNINNKLYCDIHAKLAARNNPPAPNLVPVTVPPGGKAPAHAISSALAYHSSLPTPSPASPKLNTGGSLYQTQDDNGSDVSATLQNLNISNEANINKSNNSSLNHTPVSFSKYISKGNLTAPKHFSSVSAPLSSPRAPLSPVGAAPSLPSYSPVSSTTEHETIIETTISESPLNRTEICLQINENPTFTVHPHNQINITIPLQMVPLGPQKDSKDSSPRSDYSSYSSSSSKNAQYASEPDSASKLGQLPENESHSTKDNKENDITDTNKMENARKKIMSELKVMVKPSKDVEYRNTVNTQQNSNYNQNHIESGKRADHSFNTMSRAGNITDTTPLYSRVTKTPKDRPLSYYKPEENATYEKSKNVISSQTLPDNLTFANKSQNIVKFDVLTSDNTNHNVTEEGVPFNELSMADKGPPVCCQCNIEIQRGPFITALGKIWCPEHFICATPSCRRPLQDLGFVEERGQLYCEYCFEQYLAPACSKCGAKIKGDCLKAIGKNFHPECFNCVYCGKLFGNNPFFLEDGSPYCDADWNQLFTTKCFACGFPIEAGDRWVEALSNNYHSQCFNCTMCKKSLEGQSFCAKGGRPYCKAHAR